MGSHGQDENMAVCQNLVPLVNIKIAGKWLFIPLNMVLIGIDPYPYRNVWENDRKWWENDEENDGEMMGNWWEHMEKWQENDGTYGHL